MVRCSLGCGVGAENLCAPPSDSLEQENLCAFLAQWLCCAQAVRAKRLCLPPKSLLAGRTGTSELHACACAVAHPVAGEAGAHAARQRAAQRRVRAAAHRARRVSHAAARLRLLHPQVRCAHFFRN